MVFTEEELFWSETLQLLLGDPPEDPLLLPLEYHSRGAILSSPVTLLELCRILDHFERRYAGALKTGELLVNTGWCARTTGGTWLMTVSAYELPLATMN